LPTVNKKLTGKEKLKNPADFKRVSKKGRRYSSDNLNLSVLKVGDKTEKTRIGITIPNRVEKSAVKRNKTRRLIREFFRLNKDKFTAGTDYSFYVRKNVFTNYLTMEKELKKLLKF